MEFQHGTLIGGSYTKGVVTGWDWITNGGGYNKHRDFFSVHWEVQEHDPYSVRLHVEAPARKIDSILNGIKHDLVAAILASNIPGIAHGAGYEYLAGRRVSAPEMNRNKSTEAFRIVLTPGHPARTSKDRIAAVHSILKPHVEAIIGQFSAKLNTHLKTVQ